ncbi:MAG TPA: class I SAM-dependent methyltransferase [Thermoanaerobaculia bacterium]|nr:class I SAM-dependent methyltransferase [Thermoanaerobaculia bacterium]
MLSPFSAKYAREVSDGDPGFTAEIDPGDEMYRYALRSLRGSADAAALLYFSVGRLIADSTADAIAWRFGTRGPARVLDFAAGYGRATRFLVRRLAPGALTAAEIDPAALAFQHKAFGVETLLAPRDAGDFRPSATWEAVVAASFFSHLSESRFHGWLAALWSAVAPGGLLLFSTHGPTLAGEGGDLSRGIVFRPESETDRLDGEAYGSSWVTAEFVRDAVRRSCPAGALHAVPFGLDGRQDLYAVARPPQTPGEPLALRAVPRGELDHLDVSAPRELACEGTLESEGDADVVFLAAESERGRLRIGSGASARRWRFDVDLDGVSPEDVLRVEARSAGRTRILAMGTLARL